MTSFLFFVIVNTMYIIVSGDSDDLVLKISLPLAVVFITLLVCSGSGALLKVIFLYLLENKHRPLKIN